MAAGRGEASTGSRCARSRTAGTWSCGAGRTATIADVTPPGVNARTLVHEYGGGMYAPSRGRTAARASSSATSPTSGCTGRTDGGGRRPRRAGARRAPSRRRRPPQRAWRYADGRVTPDGARSSACASGTRRRQGRERPRRAAHRRLGRAARRRRRPRLLRRAATRARTGGRLAWLAGTTRACRGTAPNCGWPSSPPTESSPASASWPAAREESVLQPLWSPDGGLHFVSDRSGWWNLYVVDQRRTRRAPSTTPRPRPWTRRVRQASLGLRPAELRLPRRTGARRDLHQDGVDHLALLERGPRRSPGPSCRGALASSTTSPSSTRSRCSASGSRSSAGSARRAVAVAARRPRERHDQRGRRRGRRHRPGYISTRAHRVPHVRPGGRRDGPGRRAGASGRCLSAHALYYPPANRGLQAPPGRATAAPRASATAARPRAHETKLDMDIQYWTSRGFAVVDVNYGGSTGYGRAYRERLRGNWGIVDTVDCINAAQYLVERGDVDPGALAVRGGSAGGYTTLNALTRHRFFAAGAAYFGLADLEALRHRRHPQVRVAVPRSARRPVSGAAATSTASARPSTTSTTSPARSSCCRAWTTPSCRRSRRR